LRNAQHGFAQSSAQKETTEAVLPVENTRI
jgi:hypothetical protein